MAVLDRPELRPHPPHELKAFTPSDLGGQPALFFDFDGTLVDLKPTPVEVEVSQALIDSIGAVAARLGGALAILSGRTIAALDQLLSPLKLPTAGIHGAERRDPDGITFRGGSSPAFDRAREALLDFARLKPGLLVEDKGRAVAVHYRAAPQLEPEVLAVVSAIAAAAPDEVAVQPGKMVVEIRLPGCTKGGALAAFMADRTFARRRPVMFGDDLTDESAFATARELGGIAVMVGPVDRPTAAGHWIGRPHDVRELLRHLAAETAA